MSVVNFPELWGGVECTVNRVGDRYFNQLRRSGHLERLDDLERFADLGIRALRYPVLWELTAPRGISCADWTWPDERLSRLRTLGIRPIVGLLHHGSGPSHTSLVDDGLPKQLASFARALAQRYPWVSDYTPVNEPLTTARFSGLYGHWYPHGKDERTFARALIQQCRATVLAMQAIREVNPAARLIQTEDMGRTFSNHALAYQRDFENERRWLSLDLLFGRVDTFHPLWKHLLCSGVTEAELGFFLDHPTPPDVVGLNYYITSDRVLDSEIEHYPPWSHGGNGRDVYADVECVRARREGIWGHRAVLETTWNRYGRPVAFTEVHMGCTREEQLRWLKEAWDAAVSLRKEGKDVRALTVWSLLGAFDWNRLVTCEAGFYEPGAFDLRGKAPRATAIAGMARSLAEKGRFEHPVLDSPGWWRRPERLWWGPPEEPRDAPEQARAPARPIVLVGATGTLGQAFARACRDRGLAFVLVGRREMDIASRSSVETTLSALKPWAVINAAGYVRVDEAENDADRCFRENTLGPLTLAKVCQTQGIRLVTFSSDLVFDGKEKRPYVESSLVSPLNIYGQSKAMAEKGVQEAFPQALVIRTSAFFGPWDAHNFVTLVLSSLAEQRPFVAADNVVVSPTYVPHLVHAALDLLIDGAQGLWNLSNTGETSWLELGRRAARLAQLDEELVRPVPIETLRLPAVRPKYSALTSERAVLLPSLDEALEHYLSAWEREATRLGGGRSSCGIGQPEEAAQCG